MTTVTISVCLCFDKTITKNRLFISQTFDHWCNFFTCRLIDMTRHQLFIEVCYITLFRRFRIHKTIFRNIFFRHIAFFTCYKFSACCFIHKTCCSTRSTRNHTIHLRRYLRRFSSIFQNTLSHLIRVTIILTITVSITVTCQAISRCY